jgi:hypothetical protein
MARADVTLTPPEGGRLMTETPTRRGLALTSIRPSGHLSSPMAPVRAALGDHSTTQALRRYWGRALGVIVLGFIAVGLGIAFLYLVHLLEGGSDAAEGTEAGAIASITVLFVSGIVAASALVGGLVSVTRAARMSEWLRRHAWEEVRVRVGHSGSTAIVLIPEVGASSDVPTVPYVLQTWRWRIKQLQAFHTLWIVRPGGRCVVVADPDRRALYVARRSLFPFVSRFQLRLFAPGMPTGSG